MGKLPRDPERLRSIIEAFVPLPKNAKGLIKSRGDSTVKRPSQPRVGRDQVESYAARKGMPIAEVERWLGPNLGYEPK
jgi:hypothetical protein